MSRRTDKFYPGWKMTRDQWASYWWHVGQCARKLGLTTAALREELRDQIHVRAFGENISAKRIDHLKMFDDVKKEFLAILKPTDVAAQVAMVNMPLIRLRHAILQFPEAYIVGLLCSPRFKRHSLAELDDMDEKELTDLRNTLSARVSKRPARSEESDLAGEAEAEAAPVEEGVPF